MHQHRIDTSVRHASLLAHGVVEDMKREDPKGFQDIDDEMGQTQGQRVENKGEISLDENTNGQTTEKTFLLERSTLRVV